jgi:ribonucleoside-diphosphate reductase alpha chain
MKRVISLKRSERALETGEQIIKFIAKEAQDASVRLARARGVFPNLKGSVYDKPEGPRMRNATVLSIAPTGTISIIAGCSSGIEPLFALAFVRNVMEGTRLVEMNPVFEEIAQQHGFGGPLLDEIARRGSVRNMEGVPEAIQKVFVTDWDISPEWHIRMQAIFQKYTDNSVSKTINLPQTATREDVRRIYKMAHELKCKGITVYRYGSKKEQVLTLPADVSQSAAESARYFTAESEYSGGCPTGSCPL